LVFLFYSRSADNIRSYSGNCSKNTIVNNVMIYICFSFHRTPTPKKSCSHLISVSIKEFDRFAGLYRRPAERQLCSI